MFLDLAKQQKEFWIKDARQNICQHRMVHELCLSTSNRFWKYKLVKQITIG